MSYSQCGQDVELARIFGTRTGRLLDIGAHDGEYISNSRLLIERGWHAVLVEPNPFHCAKALRKYFDHPHVEVICAALGDTDGLRDFYMTEGHLATASASMAVGCAEKHGWNYKPNRAASFSPEWLSPDPNHFACIMVDCDADNVMATRTLLQRFRPEVFLAEFNDHGDTSAKAVLEPLFRAAGYTSVREVGYDLLAQRDPA